MHFALSISIRRLAREEEGALASAELIMGMPVMLLLFLVLQHAYLLSRAKQETTIASRTAAMGQARNGLCYAEVKMAPAAQRFEAVTPPTCNRHEEEAYSQSGSFWSRLDSAAGWRDGSLTSHVRRATMPVFVEGRAMATYSVTDLNSNYLPGLKGPWSAIVSASFFVPEVQLWTYEDSALKQGYRDPLDRSYGSSIRLFPRLFGS